MSNPFYWDGSILRGALNSETRGRFRRVPAGPPSLPPFNSATWVIGFSDGPLYSFNLVCSRAPCFPLNTTCRVRIVNRQTPNEPPPIDFLIRSTRFDHKDVAVTEIGARYEAHFAARSELEMFVLYGDQPPPPPLAVQDDVAALTTYINGKPTTASSSCKLRQSAADCTTCLKKWPCPRSRLTCASVSRARAKTSGQTRSC